MKTTQLSALDNQIHQLLFAQHPTLLDGASRERQLLYRNLVRDGIVDTICDCLAVTCRLAGTQQLQQWIQQWLAAAGPQTRLFWQLPVDFACWLMQQPNCSSRPRLYVELIHYEAMQLEAIHAPNASWHSKQQPSRITPASHLVCHPSARLGIYTYPVFDLDGSTTKLPAKSEQPLFVVVYRKQESCHFLCCSPPIAQLLAQLQQNSSLSAGLAFLRELYESVNEEKLLQQLQQLQQQGIVQLQHLI
ncbi:MAG: putative DNA-binding domain-containing protein [Myxococcota bacterium]